MNNAFLTGVRALTIFVSIGMMSCSSLAQQNTQPAVPPVPQQQQASIKLENLFFTIEGARNLTIFARGIKAVGLIDTLKGSGPFTVLAPTDEAFNKLPAGKLEELFKPENKEQLQELLIAHVLPAQVTAAELAMKKEVQTLKRTTLKAEVDERGQVKIGKGTITQSDLVTENGVLHLIDQVLLS